MKNSRWRTVACASLFGALAFGVGPAEAQRYRDWDRDRGRDWDDDDRRGGYRLEFGRRGVEFGRERRCEWVTRRYVDEDGDVVMRRRRVCD
jgi:hypothetical protein